MATLQELIEELRSDDWHERQMAARELGQRGDPQAVGPLLEALSHEKDEDVCAAIIEALGRLGDLKATPTLRQIACHHEDTILRECAARALARLADPESIEIFIEQVRRSYNPKVREAAARALGRLKVERAAPYLVGLLEDEDRRVRQAATEALMQIGGGSVLGEVRKRMERELFGAISIPHVVSLLEHNGSREALELLCVLLQQIDPYYKWDNKERDIRQRIALALALGRLVGRTERVDVLLRNGEALSAHPVGIVQGILETLDRGGSFFANATVFDGYARPSGSAAEPRSAAAD